MVRVELDSANLQPPHPAPKQERVPLRNDRLNAARPSEAPTTAGALFIIGPPRAAAAALYDRERISTSVHDGLATHW